MKERDHTTTPSLQRCVRRWHSTSPRQLPPSTPPQNSSPLLGKFRGASTNKPRFSATSASSHYPLQTTAAVLTYQSATSGRRTLGTCPPPCMLVPHGGIGPAAHCRCSRTHVLTLVCTFVPGLAWVYSCSTIPPPHYPTGGLHRWLR